MSALKTLQVNKRAVRKAMTTALRSLSQPDINAQCEPFKIIFLTSILDCCSHIAAEQVIRRVIDSPLFQSSRSISCYLSMPSGELNTSTLVSEILHTG